MNYLSTAETAKRWGITANRITILCKDGRVPGAIQIGYHWMIPDTAAKPLDARTKDGTSKPVSTQSFRYPLFEHRDVETFYPSLNCEELQLKKAAEAFYACRFEEAKQALGNLFDSTTDRYHRISALYESCMISFACNQVSSFLKCYGELILELQQDFPYKNEMQEYPHELDATLGAYAYFAQDFSFVPEYDYHPSFLPHMSTLCLVSVFFSGSQAITPELLRSFEYQCIVLQNSEYYTDLQLHHLYLGLIYSLLGKQTDTVRHFRKVLTLAEKYELYYAPAIQYYYARESFQKAIEGFSADFINHFEWVSEDLHSRYLRFMDSLNLDGVFPFLLHGEFLFVVYAAKGYTSEEVAELTHLSLRTVNKRYREIYDLLGVRDKKAMLELYSKSTGMGISKTKKYRK